MDKNANEQSKLDSLWGFADHYLENQVNQLWFGFVLHYVTYFGIIL